MTTTLRISQNATEQSSVLLDGLDAHHLIKSLRIKVGEKIRVADSSHKLFEAHVEAVLKDGVELLIGSEIPPPQPPLPIHLFLSLLKKEKMEWVIEKAVELNVEAVHLFVASRSVRDELSGAKWQRLQKIADESLKQCGRIISLQLFKHDNFDEAVSFQTGDDLSHFFCDETIAGETAMNLKEIKKQPLGLWIGPEGGWDEDERQRAQKAGFRFVSLAPLILRAETAAIHGISSLIVLSQNQ